MIVYKTGNILESSAQCLVNTVNCEGFMGKGIAYQFKERYPENNRKYVQACKNGSFSVGKILFVEEKGKIIANFPTKDKWREKSAYSYIEDGLSALIRGLYEREISSVAIPPLGCGNGGLEWAVVKKMINEKMASVKSEVIVYEPARIITDQKTSIPRMSASHLILIKLKSSLNASQFNKLRLQKAAYFLNVFSGYDYFKFEEYKFGPYAHSIEILSKQIKAFQDTYQVSSSVAEAILYNRIISESVKSTVEKYKSAILQSASFVNSISSNHELEKVATIVAIVRLFPQFTEDEIVFYFLNNWPKFEKERFSDNEIKRSIQCLVKSNILNKELIGYSVSKETQVNKQIMPKYCGEA